MKNPDTGVTGLDREIREAVLKAKTGRSSLRNGKCTSLPIIFDRLVLDAAGYQPKYRSAREPMELRTYLGKKPSSFPLKSQRMELLS